MAIMSFDHVHIVWRNFAGAPTKFDRNGGKRSFNMVIPDPETADRLIADGFNVKVFPPRSEEDGFFATLKVNVTFGNYPPDIFLESGENVRKLDENNVAILDEIDISFADIDINPYHWENGGKTGVSAYLQGMRVVQNISRFAARYERPSAPGNDEEVPF